jgi:chaperonin GroES
VIAPDDEPETKRGSLYIPDTAKEKPTQGRVLAVGAGRFERGARIPMEVAVGDRVLYGKYSGTNITRNYGSTPTPVRSSNGESMLLPKQSR